MTRYQQEKESKLRQLRLRNGLMTQTAYTVSGLARVRGAGGSETPLVRLRNPSGIFPFFITFTLKEPFILFFHTYHIMKISGWYITIKHKIAYMRMINKKQTTSEIYFLGRGEWTGPWSERSWEWDSLNERDKELLSIRVRNDGEFW